MAFLSFPLKLGELFYLDSLRVPLSHALAVTGKFLPSAGQISDLECAKA